MGQEQSKKFRKLNKIDLEISLDKVYHHMVLQRDRKINDLIRKEIALRDAMKERTHSYDEIAVDLMFIVGIFKYITAIKIILRYCKILREHSIKICNAQQQRNFIALEDLQSYFEGIIWSAEKLNLSYIKEFNGLVYRHFGPVVYNDLVRMKKLDHELRNCFETVEPTREEMYTYLDMFLQRYKVKLKDYHTGNSVPDYKPNNEGGGQPKLDKTDFVDNDNKEITLDDFMGKINDLKFDDTQPNPNNNNNVNPQQNNNNNFDDLNYVPGNIDSGINKKEGDYQIPFAHDDKPNQNFNYPGESQVKPKNNNQDIPLTGDMLKSQGKNGNQNPAMDKKSHFGFGDILPTSEKKPAKLDPQNHPQKSIIIKQSFGGDVDYEATKYYIQSILGKDNDYKIEFQDPNAKK